MVQVAHEAWSQAGSNGKCQRRILKRMVPQGLWADGSHFLYVVEMVRTPLVLSLVFACLALGSAMTQKSPRVILFDKGFYVGEFHEGKWNQAPTQPQGVTVPIEVVGFGIGKVGGKTVIKELVHEDQSEGVVVGDNEPRGLYLSGGKPKFPRKVKTLPNNSPTYLAIVKQYLASKDLAKAEPKIRQLIRADLDGEGHDEVLINASNCTDADLGGDSIHNGGDYSGLLLRYVDKSGKLQTKELDWSQRTTADQMLTEYMFDGVADVDGGGNLEIVKSYTYYEGGGVSLLRFAKGEIEELVSATGGA